MNFAEKKIFSKNLQPKDLLINVGIVNRIVLTNNYTEVYIEGSAHTHYYNPEEMVFILNSKIVAKNKKGK